MENRSFDHLLGWAPGADGKQAGLSYTDRQGVAHQTHPLAPTFDGCGHPDPDHTWSGGRAELNGGTCDGFLRAGDNDDYAIGYYTRPDLPFLGAAAPAFTVCDRYFAAMMGPTFPNRLYLHAGATDRTSNTIAISSLPTIWDRLAAARVRAAYYSEGLPFTIILGTHGPRSLRSFSQFQADCRSGALPSVAYVDPSFSVPGSPPADDEHPPGDVRAGERFLAQVYRAVTTSPGWARTLLVVNFDEWGGFFDHVPPASVPDVKPEYQLRGFRVPCLLISPFARRAHVAHGVYDHTSILRLIEWRFGLAPLSVRDAQAANMAAALDLSRPVLAAPKIPIPPAPPVPGCATGSE
jgi:phospholipase C